MKCKAIAKLEDVPILSPNGMMELKRHEQAMLEM